MFRVRGKKLDLTTARGRSALLFCGGRGQCPGLFEMLRLRVWEVMVEGSGCRAHEVRHPRQGIRRKREVGLLVTGWGFGIGVRIRG